MTLQFWLRELTEDRDGGGSRKQRTRQSIGRSMCRPCVEAFWEDARQLTAGPPCRKGCAVCGDRGAVRIQVWLRGRSESGGKTIATTARGYCERHGAVVWGWLYEMLDGDSYKHSQSTTSPGLAIARSRVRPRPGQKVRR